MQGETFIIYHDLPGLEIEKMVDLIAIKKFQDFYLCQNDRKRWDDDGLVALLVVGMDRNRNQSFDDLKYKKFPDFENNFLMIKQKLSHHGLRIIVQMYCDAIATTQWEKYYPANTNMNIKLITKL
jgi:hypothetical protein